LPYVLNGEAILAQCPLDDDRERDDGQRHTDQSVALGQRGGGRQREDRASAPRSPPQNSKCRVIISIANGVWAQSAPTG